MSTPAIVRPKRYVHVQLMLEIGETPQSDLELASQVKGAVTIPVGLLDHVNFQCVAILDPLGAEQMMALLDQAGTGVRVRRNLTGGGSRVSN